MFNESIIKQYSQDLMDSIQGRVDEAKWPRKIELSIVSAKWSDNKNDVLCEIKTKTFYDDGIHRDQTYSLYQDDMYKPLEKMTEFMSKSKTLFSKYKLGIAIWGHGGTGNLHMKPYLDLGTIGDRQRLFKLADEYYKMVIDLGGSTSGEHNDGRMRGIYLEQMYGKDTYELFVKIKQLFDPYNTMNPGVKIGVERKQLGGMLRKEYSVKHLYDHMPRT